MSFAFNPLSFRSMFCVLCSSFRSPPINPTARRSVTLKPPLLPPHSAVGLDAAEPIHGWFADRRSWRRVGNRGWRGRLRGAFEEAFDVGGDHLSVRAGGGVRRDQG